MGNTQHRTCTTAWAAPRRPFLRERSAARRNPAPGHRLPPPARAQDQQCSLMSVDCCRDQCTRDFAHAACPARRSAPTIPKPGPAPATMVMFACSSLSSRATRSSLILAAASPPPALLIDHLLGGAGREGGQRSPGPAVGPVAHCRPPEPEPGSRGYTDPASRQGLAPALGIHPASGIREERRGSCHSTHTHRHLPLAPGHLLRYTRGPATPTAPPWRPAHHVSISTTAGRTAVESTRSSAEGSPPAAQTLASLMQLSRKRTAGGGEGGRAGVSRFRRQSGLRRPGRGGCWSPLPHCTGCRAGAAAQRARQGRGRQRGKWPAQCRAAHASQHQLRLRDCTTAQHSTAQLSRAQQSPAPHRNVWWPPWPSPAGGHSRGRRALCHSLRARWSAAGGAAAGRARQGGGNHAQGGEECYTDLDKQGARERQQLCCPALGPR